jgi:23S rRNA (guanosine2251-2'-O)-methyltransferase
MSEEQEHIYGKNSVIEALKSNTPVNRVYIRDSIGQDNAIKIIVDECRNKGIPFDVVSSQRLKTISSDARDIVATISPIKYSELKDILDEIKDKAIIIILDQISDPVNLGTIIRSAECFGACGVIIPKRSASPITSVVSRISAGAVMHVPIIRVTNISQTIDTLKDHGFWVYGTSPSAKQSIINFNFAEKSVIVIGSEGKGLRNSVEKHCDILLSIPMFGMLNSLNASVSSTILLYEITRR